MIKKVLILAIIASLLVTAPVFAQDEDTGDSAVAATHSLDEFSGLIQGSVKTEIENQFGQPDEYWGRDYAAYAYYVEDGEVVVLTFDPVFETLKTAYSYKRSADKGPYPSPAPKNFITKSIKLLPTAPKSGDSAGVATQNESTDTAISDNAQ